MTHTKLETSNHSNLEKWCPHCLGEDFYGQAASLIDSFTLLLMDIHIQWKRLGGVSLSLMIYIQYHIYKCAFTVYIWSRFAVRYHPPPPPTWYGPKTCVLQHSAWKRCICSVFCMVGCWRGPQTCKFVGFCNQPSENVLFAMFWLRHRGVVQPRPLLFLCQIVI